MNDRSPGRARRIDKPTDDQDDAADAVNAGGAPPPGGPAGTGPKPLGPRRERYLVAPLVPANPGALAMLGAGPQVDADTLLAQLDADPSCTVHRVIESTARTAPGAGQLGMFGVAPQPVAHFPKVAIVEMEADRAHMFAARPTLHVEPDLPLQYAVPDPSGQSFANPSVIPHGADTEVQVAVVGNDGKPLEGADVYLMSETFPAHGVTGPDGLVSLSMPAGALAAVAGVCVMPRYDYWSVWLGNPHLSVDTSNLVSCPALSETFPGFPERQIDGWARSAMRFDALPPTFRGDGVKVAIIDSGAAVEHPNLAGRFKCGRDIPCQNDTGWQTDTVGHGTHTAGIIGGKDTGTGVAGVAPEAELYSCKIFPGGSYGDLIEALDFCIANNIDVINLSLGSQESSTLLAAKIEHARQAGIACIVAAGNSHGPVCFPANLPSVMSVAAIGKSGTFPPESYHATEVSGSITPDGYFSASFTCYGPEVDVCAPGVAVVAPAPPVNFAAVDGTSFAAPYVTGLAALLLAHHPDFRDRYTVRSAARVDRLFELIRGSCRPLNLGDPGRSGAGLPDAVAALGLMTPVAMTPPSDPALASLWSAMAHAGLITSAVPTVAVPSLAAAAGLAAVASLAAQSGLGPPVPAPMAAAPYAMTPMGLVRVDYPSYGWYGVAPNAGQPSVPAAASAADATPATADAPTATLTAPPVDSLAPLRAAMRAAGLLSLDSDSN
jgi:subtilisin